MHQKRFKDVLNVSKTFLNLKVLFDAKNAKKPWKIVYIVASFNLKNFFDKKIRIIISIISKLFLERKSGTFLVKNINPESFPKLEFLFIKNYFLPKASRLAASSYPLLSDFSITFRLFSLSFSSNLLENALTSSWSLFL